MHSADKVSSFNVYLTLCWNHHPKSFLESTYLFKSIPIFKIKSFMFAPAV